MTVRHFSVFYCIIFLKSQYLLFNKPDTQYLKGCYQLNSLIYFVNKGLYKLEYNLYQFPKFQLSHTFFFPQPKFLTVLEIEHKQTQGN